ncbi:hypothetical protein [Tissierella creatinophila]|uniref:Peptidase family M50 n=1 Tax=Tissierella creatinophila DSM 6911 TaxID=1123403 RepID=A0A1U7M537_TISCR|nr:hypothetical protein [Tissierella creatinophila]OLS02329.1 hypothetical protein TICRE_17160 [Tissierella creatinophila DSM 6911]
MKKSSKKNEYLGYGLFVLICGGIGALFGFLSDSILKDFFEAYVDNDKIYREMFNIYFILLIIVLGYLVHIIIHEAGHLVFGLLTGYKFVSFRIGSFTLIREDGMFKWKRFNIPGTAGQCLMMPPEKKDGKFPFVIYNLGGVFMNSIFVAIGIIIAMAIKELNLINLIFILTNIAGIIVVVTNGIPMKIGGVANDGHNVISMIKDRHARDSFHLQLKVNGLLTEGMRMKDMAYEELKLPEGLDYRRPINFSRIFLVYNYHLDKMDFEKAREVLEFGSKYVDDTILVYKMEFAAEKLFLEIIGECDERKIDTIYSKNLKKYIKASKFMISKKRVMMAYEGLYKEKRESALVYLQELKKLSKMYPIKGEAKMEIMLANFIEKELEAKNI